MKKKYVSNKDETIRMFDNDILHALSKVHFSVPLFIFIPVIGYSLYLGFNSPELTYWGIGALFLVGIFIWTITEYTMHRFVFHFTPTSALGEKIHFLFHGVHHDYPNDSYRLVLPPAVSIPLASGFYFLFDYLITGDTLYPFFAGFILGYLIYDMLHYAIHHVEYEGKIWKTLKSHHLKHHYVDDTKGFGVSSPIWDALVGSNFEKRNLTRSKVSQESVEH